MTQAQKSALINNLARCRVLREREARKEATPGFAVKITDNTQLGIAILMAETPDGAVPISTVISIAEAKGIAASSSQLCRDYTVWARGLEGRYEVAGRFNG